MIAPYTAYIQVEFDRTNEGNYARKVYSVDCMPEDLVFVSQLPQTQLLGNGDSVLEVSILHASKLTQAHVDEYFNSLEELIVHFGSIRFKK